MGGSIRFRLKVERSTGGDKLFSISFKQKSLLKNITAFAALYGAASFLYSLIKSSEININAIVLTTCTLVLLSLTNTS